MKLRTYLTAMAVAVCGGLTVSAADKVEAGPKGGRILEKTSPKAEFFIEKDRTVSINFYDGALKPVPVADQSVTVVADTKDGKEKLDFEKKGNSLVSKTKLPEGDALPVVVQFKQTGDAKPQNVRFKVDTHNCGECKRAEYACVCDH